MTDPNALSVDFLIPFSDEEWPGLRVSFHRWLPIGNANGITRIRGRYQATLWFEEGNIYTLRPSGFDDLSTWGDLPVGKVHISISFDEISQDLARFIYERVSLTDKLIPSPDSQLAKLSI
jgi:hypothetical protein